MLDTEKLLVFDVETTGLLESPDPAQNGNEILQLAMISGTGRVALNQHFRPRYKIAWPEAEKIHGISSADVQDKPLIEEFKPQIQNLIDAADLLIAYNFAFDYTFLRSAGISCNGKKYCDVMKVFANRRGLGGGLQKRYSSLQKCAEYHGYQCNKAHDALQDAQATLHCFLKVRAGFNE